MWNTIFNLDNKFFRVVNKIIDCVVVSIVWCVFCIPIFTIGAATAGLYYTVNKSIMHGRGYAVSEFWHGFKTSFKQATVVWLIFLAIGLVFGVDGYIMYQFAQVGDMSGAIYVIFIVLFCLEVAWANYVFPYIARFTDKTGKVLKFTGILAIAHLPETFLMFVFAVLAVIVVYLFTPAILFISAFYMLGINMVIEKIFRKHMSEEDIAAEDERNKEYFN